MGNLEHITTNKQEEEKARELITSIIFDMEEHELDQILTDVVEDEEEKLGLDQEGPQVSLEVDNLFVSDKPGEGLGFLRSEVERRMLKRGKTDMLPDEIKEIIEEVFGEMVKTRMQRIKEESVH